MKCISMFKTMTFVCFLVVGISINAIADDQASCTKRGGVWHNDQVVNQQTGEVTRDKSYCEDKAAEKCRSLKEEKNKTANQFKIYCQEEEQKKLSDCDTRLKECTETQSSEMPFSALTSVMNMSAIGNLTGDSEGTCSKYSADKLETLMDKAQSNLDKKEEKQLEAARKQASDEEKDNETLQKKNEEFLKQQEDKAADELKSKEDQRNQQAAFEKQQQEYNAKIRSISDEIFTTQKAQQILLKKRQIDIANYKNMMLAASAKCTKEAKSTLSSLDSNSNKASNLGSLQSKDKAVRDFYAACLDQETARRITDAEQFKADMEKFDRQVANKTAELEEVKKSLQSLTNMFQQAALDAQNKKNQDDVAFAKKQQAKWMEINQFGQNMLNKKNTNAQALQKATGNVTQASNELMKLKSQTPVAASKGPEDIRKDYLSPYKAAIDNYADNNCDTVLGISGSKATDKKGSSGGGADGTSGG